MFSKLQHEILLGLMLGDGGLRLSRGNGDNRNAQLRITRAVKDEEYLIHNRDIFKNFMSDKDFYRYDYYDKRYDKTYCQLSLDTKFAKEFTIYYNKWYLDDIKIIPTDIKLTAKSIAIWICDDGSFDYTASHSRLRIATNGFTKNEVEFLKHLLDEKYKINMLVETQNNNYILCLFKKRELYTLLSDIHTHIPISMSRKLDKINSFLSDYKLQNQE